MAPEGDVFGGHCCLSDYLSSVQFGDNVSIVGQVHGGVDVTVVECERKKIACLPATSSGTRR